MTRLNATERLRRLLAVIPWANGKGEVSLEELSTRFDYPLERLRRDLSEVVQFVGVYPYTPDMLIEVDLDEEHGRVRFELADYFKAPLRLTPEEALSLVSAGLGLLGAERGQATALERGLEKVAARFDVELGDDIEVSLGGASPALVEQAMAAVDQRRCLELSYLSRHRSEPADRVVEPHRVFSESGEWYLKAFCRLVDEERTFRLDRVLSLIVSDETFEEGAATASTTVFAPAEDDVRVTLDLGPDAAWVSDAYPLEERSEVDGTVRIVLAVSSIGWLERLLLQLGPAAVLVDSTPSLAPDFRATASSRVLQRYET